MESETFRYILLALLIPFTGYKVHRIYRKLNNLSEEYDKKTIFKFKFNNEN